MNSTDSFNSLFSFNCFNCELKEIKSKVISVVLDTFISRKEDLQQSVKSVATGPLKVTHQQTLECDVHHTGFDSVQYKQKRGEDTALRRTSGGAEAWAVSELECVAEYS